MVKGMVGAAFATSHYPSFQHHCRFKIPLHCQILNRQWHTDSDARWLLLPVLHPTVIRFRKTKKINPTSMLAGACSLPPLPPPCSLATAATPLSISSKKKNSYITDKGRIQHIRKTHPQIDSYIADEGEGFNTSQINPSINRFVHHRQRIRVQHKQNNSSTN